MKLSDFNTLAEAKLYSTTTGALINRDSLNGWLGGAGIYKRMKAIAADDTSPFCDVLEAFLDSVDYNFIQGTTTGDAHIALLDSLIGGESSIGAQLAALKPLVISRANVPSFPFADSTAHDFAVAKDVQTRFKSIPNSAIENNYLKITTTADCEAHRPSVYRLVHGQYVRLTSFPLVDIAGDYIAMVNNHRDLFVDNVYGVVA